MNIRKAPVYALAITAIVMSGSTLAQTRIYNFGDVTSPGSCPSGTSSSPLPSTFGNVLSCSSVSPSSTATTLQVRAFSSTANSTGTTVLNSSTAGTHYQTAAVNYHGTGSGIGVANRFEGAVVTGSPSHAMDNSTPGVDLLLLNFVNVGAQALTSVTLGWAGADGDFQVLRWAGANSVTSVAGKTAAQLLTDGWALVGNVQNGLDGAAHQTFSGFNTGGLTSSSWIISAYTSAFGGTGFTNGVDAIKVRGVTARPASSVSAPGTLALAGLGLAVAGGLRRRRI